MDYQPNDTSKFLQTKGLDMEKSYYAIIPATVRYDADLMPNAKLLYGEITALCNQKGYCWANNQYFADLYNVDKLTISRWISKLKRKNYIKTNIKYHSLTSEIMARHIYINDTPIDEKINTPIDEKVKDNNTETEYYKRLAQAQKEGYEPTATNIQRPTRKNNRASLSHYKSSK